jgi:hypothetical protein
MFLFFIFIYLHFYLFVYNIFVYEKILWLKKTEPDILQIYIVCPFDHEKVVSGMLSVCLCMWMDGWLDGQAHLLAPELLKFYSYSIPKTLTVLGQGLMNLNIPPP